MAMRRYLLCALAVGLFFSLSYAQLEIEEAILYRYGATVIAKSVAYVKKGKNFLGFLPKDVDKGSVAIAPNCEVASIIGIDWGDPKETPVYKELKSQLGTLESQRASLEERAKFYAKLIDSLARAYGNNRYLNYLLYEKKFKELHSKELALRQKVSLITTKIDQISKKLRELEDRVAMYVWATAEDQCEMTVSFNTSKAHWEPVYLLIYNKGKATLELMAKVSQSTGVDWKDVNVALSSSQPTRFLELPEVKPFNVYVITRTSRMLMMAPGARVPSKGMLKSIERRSSGYSFNISTPISLTSGREEVFSLKEFKWRKVEPERVCVPSYKEGVYVKISLTAPSLPLPNGKLKIVEGNSYIGEVDLSEVLSGGKLTVPLGIDPEIEVKRKVVDKRVEKTWSGNYKLTFTYRITLYNSKDVPVSVKLMEPLPVSKDDRVTVKIREIKPKPDKVDKLGIAHWNINLKPQQKVEITYTFTVQYPENTIVNID